MIKKTSLKFPLIFSGYTIKVNPSDVNSKDINTQLEKTMWDKYSVNGRYHLVGAKVAILSAMHGKIWDMEGGGQSSILCANGEAMLISPKYKNYEDVIVKCVPL